MIVGTDAPGCSAKLRSRRADGKAMSVTTLDTRPAPLSALLGVLRQQDALLERLQLVTTTLRLLLAAGEARHLSVAADEHQELCHALHALDAARAVHAEHLAEVCGAPADSDLEQLAANLGESAAVELRAAGARLAGLADELTATQQDAEGLALALSARSAEVLQRLSTGGGGGYDHDGVQPVAVSAPVWVDARA